MPTRTGWGLAAWGGVLYDEPAVAVSAVGAMLNCAVRTEVSASGPLFFAPTI